MSGYWSGYDDARLGFARDFRHETDDEYHEGYDAQVREDRAARERRAEEEHAERERWERARIERDMEEEYARQMAEEYEAEMREQEARDPGTSQPVAEAGNATETGGTEAPMRNQPLDRDSK